MPLIENLMDNLMGWTTTLSGTTLVAGFDKLAIEARSIAESRGNPIYDALRGIALDGQSALMPPKIDRP